MPKAVDIYVLDKKIGAGQFGDVFKGYSKVDGTDVAIKTIRRDRVKGKFTELLDNEIQVLKSCKNNNIIRLIDIKKTVNNIYLILEFCNEGDLGAYLKEKKNIPQQQAIEYFVQILHGFETLVKNKIMHRDFKLPNVLKHDGVAKIADFGFAKLLGEQDQQAETILGSPLNMAPQVLDHKAYNNKADIWSIGVAFYELVFGKVPYIAGNIIDLLKRIKNDPLTFPRPCHPLIEDVLKKMLVVNPQKRIQWHQLFQHPITRVLEQQIQDSLQQSMLCKKDELQFNISKFYIKTNKVIENTNQLFSKQELNKFVKNVLDNKEVMKYEGPLIKRKNQRQQKQSKLNINLSTKSTQRSSQKDMKTQKNIQNDLQDMTQIDLMPKKSPKEKLLKQNAQKLLHQRNKYAFYGHLAEELLELNTNKYSYCLAFLMVKKVIQQINQLKIGLKSKKLQGIQKWQDFDKSQEYKKINIFLSQEEEIFNKFYEKLALKVFQQGTLSQFEEEMMISGKFTRQETNKRIYTNVMREYVRAFEDVYKKNKSMEKKLLCHIIKLIDSNDHKMLNDFSFNFNKYYDSFNQLQLKEAEKRYQKSLQTFKKTIS